MGGRGLADMETFLILTNLLNTHVLCAVDGDDRQMATQFESGTAVLRNPKPYRVVFEKRSDI